MLRTPALLKSVSIAPGASTFTVMPRGLSSFARYFVRVSMAPSLFAKNRLKLHLYHPVPIVPPCSFPNPGCHRLPMQFLMLSSFLSPHYSDDQRTPFCIAVAQNLKRGFMSCEKLIGKIRWFLLHISTVPMSCFDVGAAKFSVSYSR